MSVDAKTYVLVCGWVAADEIENDKSMRWGKKRNKRKELSAVVCHLSGFIFGAPVLLWSVWIFSCK